MSDLDLNGLLAEAITKILVAQLTEQLQGQIAYRFQDIHGKKIQEEVLNKITLEEVATDAAKRVVAEMNDTTKEWYGSESKAANFKRRIKEKTEAEIARMLAEKYVSEMKAEKS